MNVTIKDRSGTIVGVGSAVNFDEADLVTFDPASTSTDPMVLAGMQAKLLAATECWLKFEVPVKKAEFYQIEAGRRGGLSYSFDDLDTADWFVHLTLGSR